MRVVHRAASGRAKPVGCCGCPDHGPCGGYVDAWSHASPEQACGEAWWRFAQGTAGGVQVEEGGAVTLVFQFGCTGEFGANVVTGGAPAAAQEGRGGA